MWDDEDEEDICDCENLDTIAWYLRLNPKVFEKILLYVCYVFAEKKLDELVKGLESEFTKIDKLNIWKSWVRKYSRFWELEGDDFYNMTNEILLQFNLAVQEGRKHANKSSSYRRTKRC